jgi:hypothetical protein
MQWPYLSNSAKSKQRTVSGSEKKGALCLLLPGRELPIQKNDWLKPLLSFDDIAGVINYGAYP